MDIFKNVQNKRLFKILGEKPLGSWLLCISTREPVLRTPFAGRNTLFNAKTTFSVTNGNKWTEN